LKSLSRVVEKTEASQTLALTALAKKLHDEGVDVVTLTAGEPDFPTPFHVKEAAKKAIEDNRTTYTQNAGIPELRKAIAEKFQKDNNLSFSPNQILVSNGAKHSLYNSLKAICNEGDEVIIPAPYWVSYPQMVALVGAVPVVVHTSEENEFKLTTDELSEAITDKTKALLFCTPSNPTGSVYSQRELEDLAAIIAHHEIYVIADEILFTAKSGPFQAFPASNRRGRSTSSQTSAGITGGRSRERKWNRETMLPNFCLTKKGLWSSTGAASGLWTM
jgi:aspartate aminotransferase